MQGLCMRMRVWDRRSIRRVIFLLEAVMMMLGADAEPDAVQRARVRENYAWCR